MGMEKTHLMKKISREIKKMGEEAENELPRYKNRRETRPHGKENQGKGPDGPHEKDDEDEDEDLDVVADDILANLNQFKQYAIVQFQSKNFTESAFERIGARFEGISREMKNYRYKFEQAAEKMNNKTRVRELYEKKQLMKKISREINNMGEEREAELPRYKNRRENQGKRNGSENKNSPRNSTRNPNGKGPHAKRNGTENKNSTRNSTRRPNRKGPHAKRNGSENKNSTRNSTRNPNGKGPHAKRNG